MRRSPRERLIFLIAIVFAVVPFAFGLIRAHTTGSDFRYLWVAIASFIGVTVMTVGSARARTSTPSLTLPALVLLVATLAAAATAFLLGANSIPAVLVVALAYGLCFAASSALYIRSRLPPTPG
jgi:predicted neutral ceramidase superfamily lipid hydrolase